MKTLAFALVAVLSLSFAKADILVNGDFHDGKAHWKGDIHAASDSDTGSYGTSSMDQTGGAPGIVVELKKAQWPKAYQTFNTHDNSFNYSVTFKLSPDYAPASRPQNGLNPPPGHPPGTPNPFGPRNEFLSSVLGGNFVGNLTPPTGNDFLLFVVDLTAATYSAAVIHPTPGTDSQTITGVMKDVPAHDEKVLYLVFNGGKGNVTLLNVALTPLEKTASPDANPFSSH